MHLGVDLDNTLVCYDEVFLWGAHHLKLLPDGWSGNRKEVRDYLRSDPYGEEVWQRLQGKVYGHWMYRASLFVGVYRFLWRCRVRKIRVDIVSHKSMFGHFDREKIPLRDCAMDFLRHAGLFSENDNSMIKSVEFVSNQEKKLQLIEKKNFDWFIDDIPELLESEKFPTQTSALLFEPNGNGYTGKLDTVISWSELERRLLGQWTTNELREISSDISNTKINSVEPLSGGGNTSISKIQFFDKNEAALKIYWEDSQHDRLYSEYESVGILHKRNITQVPKPIGVSRTLKAAMYQWVDGKPLDEPTKFDLDQALEFLEQIQEIQTTRDLKHFPDAAAAVFSGSQLEEQFIERLSDLNKYSEQSGALQRFLKEELKPTANEIIKWCKSNWLNTPSYYDSLGSKERVLSPSDFGFHNALRESTGRVIFLDFEYFGWDDPAKLVGDFMLHPGMHLSNELKAKWMTGTEKLFGSQVTVRVRTMWPLLGLCWCIIMLNVYRRDIWLRRVHARSGQEKELDQTKSRQLNRSRNLLNELREQYRKFPY